MNWKKQYQKALTFSYDDGNVQDKKLLDILNRYGMKCTFNVNTGLDFDHGTWVYRDVLEVHRLNLAECPELYAGHEMAVHGVYHYNLTELSPAELTARVDALYRRSGGEEKQADSGEIFQPPFLLNTRNRTLEKNGKRIKLTQVEYSVIKLFMDNPGKALSRDEILESVWGRDYYGEVKIVDVNIRRLRLKVEDDPTNPTYITTVWGYGYKWGF